MGEGSGSGSCIGLLWTCREASGPLSPGAELSARSTLTEDAFSHFALTEEDPQHCAIAAGWPPGCAPHGGVAESARVGQQRLPQSLIHAVRIISWYKAPQSGACGKQGAGLCTPSPTSPRTSLYTSLQLPTSTDETPSSVPRGVQEFAAQAAGRLAARSLGFSAPGPPRPCPPLAVPHPRPQDAPAAPRSWCLRLLNQPS